MTTLLQKIGIKRAAIALTLLVVGGAGIGYALSEKPKKLDEAAKALDRPVLVRKVLLGPGKPPRVLVGTLRARVEGDQGFRVAGKIAERRVQAGDRVKTGAILAILDSTDLRLQREAAEAELTAAKSAELQASAELQRVIDLRKQGWSTEQTLDRQKATRDETTGRRTRAERQLEIALNSQSYAQLSAASDGVVTLTYAEAGQVVSAGQPILRIAQDGNREALVAIPELALEEARAGTAEVALWTGAEKTYPARLRELSPSADPATRTFAARYVITGLPADAALGMSVTLNLLDKEQAMVARVPLSSVLNQGGGSVVFVFDTASKTLQRLPVNVLSYDSREAKVSGVLKEGDQVAALGVHKLVDGQKVRVILDTKND